MTIFLTWLLQVAIILVIGLAFIHWVMPAPKKPHNGLPVDWKDQF